MKDVTTVPPWRTAGSRDGTAPVGDHQEAVTNDMATTIRPRGRNRRVGAAELSDAELLERVRAGDERAYGELYVRHESSAASLARYLTHSRHEADDVVADAFARVLRAIRGGAGPTEAFRPYLLTAVRRTVWRRSEEAAHAGRLASSEDEAEVLDIRLAVDAEDHSDEAIVLQAFQGMPERWQLVLWHTEIEGQPPAEVAPLLGLSANATAALAVRAREGLRQAYLQAHLQARPADACRFSVEHLGAFVREGLGKRDKAKVEEHISDCTECQELQSDLGSLNKALRGVVGPAVVGAGAAGWLRDRARDAAGASEAVEHARGVAHRVRFPHAAGVAGVAAVGLVALGLSSDIARPPEPVPVAAPADVVPIALAGRSMVDGALFGTPAVPTPGVTSAGCEGGAMPLSLPAGARPVSASFVRSPGGASESEVVDPSTASGLEPVPSGDTVLVGEDGACVANLITPLDRAPSDTALSVTFLDRLGNLQVLLVTQIVTVVQDALAIVTDQVDALNAQLAEYFRLLSEAAAGLTPGAGGGTGVDGTVDGLTGSGGVDVPGVPPVDVPDLPALPPVGGGGGVDDVVDDVGGVVDDVGGLVDDAVCGLLGCP